MASKRPKPEEIVSKLRQVEVRMGQGMRRLDAIRQIGVVNRPITVAQAVWWNGAGSIEGTEATAEGERPSEASCVGPDTRQIDPRGSSKGKLLSSLVAVLVSIMSEASSRSRNAELAGCWGNTDPRKGVFRGAGQMKADWWPK